VIGTYVQEDRLWIADPRAINHILQRSGYLYAKPRDIQEQAALFNDRGIGSVEGEPFIAISHFFHLTRLTIQQARYTNATGGRWLRRLVSSRLKVCYHILWMLLQRCANPVNVCI